MTYLGHVSNGSIKLDDSVCLPEGAPVRVELLNDPSTGEADAALTAMLLRHAGKGKDLPADLAANHDHYAHGKPLQ